MFIANSIHYSNTVYNYFKDLNLGLFLSDVYIHHLMSITTAVFQSDYSGKTINFAENSDCHRTTIAHFLNHGKWDDRKLQKIIKQMVVDIIYKEASRSGKPVFCIVDDTIASHTKPSSQALHPMEAAYFHQSHLKKKQDYGHQAVAVMLSCNEIILNYAIVLYDKSKSKIEIVQNIADELPKAPVKSYFLCDSWYSSSKIMESFIKKGFYTIGALKTNRIIYPCGIRIQASKFAAYLRKQDADVSLVTVDHRQFYVCRWPIEVFFRESKRKLALDKYQIRTCKGTQRYWLIMSLVHFMCCTCKEDSNSFEIGYQHLKQTIKNEKIGKLYTFIRDGMLLKDVLKLVG